MPPLYHHTYRSPLGNITCLSTSTHLIALYFDEQKRSERFSKLLISESSATPPVLLQTIAWLDQYFAGQIPIAKPPLAPQGTTFQQLVWRLLLEVPYGETTTYSSLAASAATRLQKSHMSAQAIGQAVSRNPISLIIPCHRIIGRNHQLTGYAGGLDRKIWLLKHENKHLVIQ